MTSRQGAAPKRPPRRALTPSRRHRPEHARTQASREPPQPAATFEPDEIRATLERIPDLDPRAIAPASVQQLASYLGLLSRWGTHYNLTARLTRGELLDYHLGDSAVIVPSLRRAMDASREPNPADGDIGRSDRSISVLDVGSGAGLPGVVIASLCPDWNVWTIDTVGKKVAFVRQAVAEAGIPNLSPLHGTAQAMALPAAASPGFDLIVARAVAPIDDLVSWTAHLLAPGGYWALMKGATPHDEIDVAQARGIADVFHVERLSVPNVDAARCLVWLRRR